MKDTINFLYNIYINELEKINDDYYFNYQNKSFMIALFNRDLNEATELYELDKEMLASGLNLDEIMLTKDNSVLFYYEENYYVLMRLADIKNHQITYKEILNLRYIPQKEYKLIDKSNWSHFWENKIDYFEYQFSSVQNKYPIIKSSINYYIGIWENAISYFNNNINNTNLIKEVCHKRVGVDTDLLSFLNPLNYVIDYKIRDVSEYLKSYIYEENFTENKIEEMLDKLLIDKQNVLILISRTLFPSNYFDIYEKIIIDNDSEEKLKNIIKKHNNYSFLIKVMFKKYKNYNIPEIPWIINNVIS